MSRLDSYLRRAVEVGNLSIAGDGGWRAFGDGTGPAVALRLSRGAARR